MSVVLPVKKTEPANDIAQLDLIEVFLVVGFFAGGLLAITTVEPSQSAVAILFSLGCGLFEIYRRVKSCFKENIDSLETRIRDMYTSGFQLTPSNEEVWKVSEKILDNLSTDDELHGIVNQSNESTDFNQKLIRKADSLSFMFQRLYCFDMCTLKDFEERKEADPENPRVGLIDWYLRTLLSEKGDKRYEPVRKRARAGDFIFLHYPQETLIDLLLRSSKKGREISLAFKTEKDKPYKQYGSGLYASENEFVGDMNKLFDIMWSEAKAHLAEELRKENEDEMCICTTVYKEYGKKWKQYVTPFVLSR